MRLSLILLVLYLCACVPASAQSALERVVRGTGTSEPSLEMPRERALARVCAGPDLPAGEAFGEPVALYRARGVQSVTHDLPFVAAPRDGRTHCDLVLQGRPIRPADGMGVRLDYEHCALLVSESRPQQVIIAPRSGVATGKDRFVLAECVYRLAMYVQGYRGALAEPSATMFVTRDSQAVHMIGKPYVGPRSTGIPSMISWRCPDLPSLYYGSDLSAALERSCAGYNEPLRLR